MASKIDPAELATINDLLNDFAVDKNLTAEEVYKTSWSRYSFLEQASLHTELKQSLFLRILGRTIYSGLPLAFHRFIYDDIFTFAGKFRSIDDPKGGRIFFGGQNAQRRKPTFEGFHPSKIGEGVFDASMFLTKKPNDALYQAMRFYQKFVQVHPFYDANGRIGRLIATMYLANNNLVLSWSEFDYKGKFINKLNWCHKNPSEESFGYLVDYLREFTLPLSDLEG